MSDEPLESQKASIVKQLIGMNANIRNFSEGMEEKLERAYKAGNYSKKFGYEGSHARNMEAQAPTTAPPVTAFEKMMAKDNQ